MKKIAIGVLLFCSFLLASSNSYKDNNSSNSNEENNPEIICNKAYECVDGCPTVAYKKCVEKCVKKYPCEDLEW